MIDIDKVSEFVNENFINISSSNNGNHWIFRCPLCGDSKKSKSKRRFNLDYNNGRPIYHCWNCGESGSFLSLYSKIKEISINEAKSELYSYNSDFLKRKMSKNNNKTLIKKNKYYYNYIMDDCITLKNKVNTILYPKYYEILLNFYKLRKIDTKYIIGISYKGDYKGRIIIPIYENNNIIYFQARRIPKSEFLPKYKNPISEKSNIILNKNKFNKNKYIIVTEGILDSYSIGNQSTTYLGSYIKDEFIKELLLLTNKGVVIIFDNDEPGYKGLQKFMYGEKNCLPNNYCKKVYYFLFPNEYNSCGDINNIKVKYNINLYHMIIKNLNTYFDTCVKLKLKE